MNKKTELSFEFFPPKTAKGEQSLARTWQQLNALQPDCFTVTFGAGGSTQAKTLETVLSIKDDIAAAAVPHISCIACDKATIQQLLNSYQEKGLDRIVALRGDLPSGMGQALGELPYACDLVEFARQQTGDHFTIYVAAYPECHPEAKSLKDDMTNFKRKVQAGANAAITQYFYNIDAYLAFRDECVKQKIDIPIIPGIMPILDLEKLIKFSSFCGADIPRWLYKKLLDFADDKAAMQAYGVEVVTRLCEELIKADVPGLHFYTLNQARLSLAICHNLSLNR